jgi:hypothetical protein
MPTVRTMPEALESAYLDFELEIGLGQGREYPVTVLRSPSGEAHGTLHFPYDESALESRLKDLQIALLMTAETRRRLPTLEEQPVRRFGQELFDALLAGEIRSAYDVSWRQAEAQGKGLRVKLRVQSPALAGLPWEFLYDPREGEYLCLMSDRPVVRYIEAVQPMQPLQVIPPLRILGMAASPTGLAALDVEQEKLRLAKATEELQGQGLVEVRWLEGQTWRDLQRAMRGGPWHIFHFVGHGGFDPVRDEGLIVVAGDDGGPQYLTATDFSRLLADHKPLRLVLLNACEGARGGSQDIFSSTASRLVRRGIPAVVAMQYPITDRVAVEFARSFYESLADGLPADAAVAEARKTVSIAVTGTLEWGTPVLFMRAADGAMFDLADQRPGAFSFEATDMAGPAPQKSAHAGEQKTPQKLPTQTKSTTLPTGTGSTGQTVAKPSRQRAKPGTTVKPSAQKPEPGAIASPPLLKIESAATTEPVPPKTEPAVNAKKRSDAEPRKTAGPGPDVSQVSTPKQRLSRLNLELSVQPVSVEDGGAITWTITVSNAGDDDLREVEVKIGAFSLGTLALSLGESRQMTGSAALAYSSKPTVLHFVATGLNSLGQEVHAEAQRAIEVLPRRKVQLPPAAPPKSAALSPEEVATVLQQFKRNGLYVAPDIPIAKLQKAQRECQTPKNETGLGLIEGAVFGWYSCLLFGARGIYYCNPKNVLGGQPGPGSVAYADLPACELKADSWHMRISLREGRFLDVRNLGMVGAVNPNLIAEVLNSIKKLVAAR